MAPFYFQPKGKEGEPAETIPLTQDEPDKTMQLSISDLGATRVYVTSMIGVDKDKTDFLLLEPLESQDRFPVLSGIDKKGKAVTQIRNYGKGVLFDRSETPVALSIKRDQYDNPRGIGTIIFESGQHKQE